MFFGTEQKKNCDDLLKYLKIRFLKTCDLCKNYIKSYLGSVSLVCNVYLITDIEQI